MDNCFSIPERARGDTVLFLGVCEEEEKVKKFLTMLVAVLSFVRTISVLN